jgi:hypothetical protein
MLAELMWGSLQAALLFWGGHIWTVLAVTIGVVVPLYHMGFQSGLLLFTALDVGPSAGFFSCLGGVMAGLHRQFRWVAGILVSAVLIAVAIVRWKEIVSAPQQVIADMSHVAAFGSAFGVTVTLKSSKGRML